MAVQLLFSKAQPASTALLFGSSGGETLFANAGEVAAAYASAAALSSAYVVSAEATTALDEQLDSFTTSSLSAEQAVALGTSSYGSLLSSSGDELAAISDSCFVVQATLRSASEAATVTDVHAAGVVHQLSTTSSAAAAQVSALEQAITNISVDNAAFASDTKAAQKSSLVGGNEAVSAVESYSANVLCLLVHSEQLHAVETLFAEFAGQVVFVMVDPDGDAVLISRGCNSRVLTSLERTICFKSNPSNSDVI